MAGRLRGQFYMVGALMIMMYLIFLSRVFVTIQTEAELPEIREPNHVFHVLQEIADQGGDTEEGGDVLMEALKYTEESVQIDCDAPGGESGCLLEEAYWQCGVNVTVLSGSRNYVKIERTIQSDSGWVINATRKPFFIKPNATANLVEVSLSVDFPSPVFVDDGEVIKSSCSGGTCTIRTNLVEDRPKVVYAYNVSGESSTIFRDIGILNATGYDGQDIIDVVSRYWSYDRLTLSDLGKITGQAGPALLFIPSEYPESYGNTLKEYVREGGTLVVPHGLCRNLECLVGNIERITDTHTLANYSGFTVNVSTTNSNYFADLDEPWAIYNSTETNSSRAAIGALRYGDGWIIFLGNESMLSTWDRLEEFINFTVSRTLPAVSVSTEACPIQKV